MSFYFSEVQEKAYAAMVELAKEEVQETAFATRKTYETSAAIQLVKEHDIQEDEAIKTVQNRCRDNLTSEDLIHFRDQGAVTVDEVLADSLSYDKQPCADPIEPEEGKARAMFFANTDTCNPLINSMLHGGRVFILGTNNNELIAENEEPIPIEELIEFAKILDEGDLSGIKELINLAADKDSIEMQQLLLHIKESTGMTLGAMRGFMRSESGFDDELDHLDLARIVIKQIGPKNILGDNLGVYIYRNRGVWELMKKGYLQQLVQKVIEENRDVLASVVDGVTKVLTNEVYRPNHKFNIGDPEVINCLNGELHLNKDIGKWELRPHDREAYRTSQIPVSYSRDADAPRFRQFLQEIFRDDSDRRDKTIALLEMIGYSMVAHCEYERFIILIGAGANGKSVILSILEALLGSENTVGVQPSQFDNRFQRAHLQHKLANIVTEIKQGEVIADAELKAIVSGEPSTVENKHKDPFTLRPYATCWFATNHMPHTRDFSEALFRRALILKFDRVFTDDEKDTSLTGTLKNELPGILNYALGAYANAVMNGFTKPESSEVAKQEWRLEADQVQQFTEDCCKKSPDEELQSSMLYSAYKWWADANGIHRTLTQKSFRDRLTRLGYGKRHSSSARYVTGIDKGAGFPGHYDSYS